MYAQGNPRTKKELKRRVAAYLDGSGPAVRAFQPGGIFPGTADGFDTIEGPHYPEPHRFYARVEIRAGIIVRVIS